MSSSSSSQPLKRQKLSVARGEDGDDDDYGEGSSSINWSEEEIARKVKDLIRYVLACELKKQPIRRDDINKKVLVERSRDFNKVFNLTQHKLRHVFGMELAELPAKELPPVVQGKSETNATTAAAKKTQTSRSFMLRNILPEKYNVSELIKRPEEEYAQIGVLYVILALIFTNEQALLDGDLKEHLDRLKILSESTTFGDRNKMLDTFVSQGYLWRQKAGSDRDTDPSWEYYWGPRAKTEVPEENIVEFISNLYGQEGQALDELRANVYKAAGYDVR